MGSAWLIRKFIDPQAKFVFASDPPSRSGLIPFDMVDVEFSHQGDCCTFETLIRRFAIEDKAVRKIGEMIHDADLDDAKFQRVECIGIDRVLKGWGKPECAMKRFSPRASHASTAFTNSFNADEPGSVTN